MVTSPLPTSPSLRRRTPFPSLLRFISRRPVRQPLSACEEDRLRERLNLEHRARKEADAVRREVEMARAQAYTLIH